MKILSAEFLISNTDSKKFPAPSLPEYAFIGRSNVGKSSLINALTGKEKLAKTSGTPGKTQLVNHFIINQQWYLVDLPGYGWAKVSKTDKQKFSKMIENYLLERENLMYTFVLVDCRHKPQANDLDFMRWLGERSLPFAIVFTKTDKLKPLEKKEFVKAYEDEMLKEWEEMPKHFVTSVVPRDSAYHSGKEALLGCIEEVNKLF